MPNQTVPHSPSKQPNNPVSPPPIPPQAVPTIKPTTNNKFILGLLAGILSVAILGGGIALGVWYSGNRSRQAVVDITPSPTTETQTPSSSPTTPSTSSPDAIIWLPQPVKANPINLFKTQVSDTDLFIVDSGEFFHVADLPDGSQLLNAYFDINAPGGSMLLRLIQDPDNQVSIVSSLADEWTLEEFNRQKLAAVTQNDIVFNELNPPDSFTVNNIKLNKGYAQGTFLSEYAKTAKLFDSPYGTIYRYDKPIFNTDQIWARTFLLQLPDTTVIPYTPESLLLSSDNQASVAWTDGRSDIATYTQSIISGCGGGLGLFGSIPIIKPSSTLLNDKVKVGNGPYGGDDIIQLKNTDNLLVNSLYQNYKSGRDYEGGPGIIPIEDYNNQPNHFLWQDSLGDWQIFANNDYAPMAECGKPVIYLYPETQTVVDIQVGANIRVSEPTYPDFGWQVTAHPDGKLISQGQTYPNLFWEGLGYGPYPDYQEFGVVVKQSDLVGTLTTQLYQQGLTPTEADDFMSFWTPKLPQTPYVRLTWLGTPEMNRLAPLTVSPQPQTVIRVFLEFEGLTEYRQLIPQRFNRPSRQGFTLVEWGGLLRK